MYAYTIVRLYVCKYYTYTAYVHELWTLKNKLPLRRNRRELAVSDTLLKLFDCAILIVVLTWKQNRFRTSLSRVVG